MTETPEFPVMDEPKGTVITDDVPAPDHKKSRTQSGTSKFVKELGSRKAKTPAPRALKNGDIEKLAQFYGMVGMGLMPFNGRAAVACMENAEQCAESWRQLADSNPAVRRVLLAILEGGAWGAVISAHIPIMLACLPGEIRDRFGFLDNEKDEEKDEDK